MPLDTAKTRVIVHGAKNPIVAMTDVVRESGPRGLYAGMMPFMINTAGKVRTFSPMTDRRARRDLTHVSRFMPPAPECKRTQSHVYLHALRVIGCDSFLLLRPLPPPPRHIFGGRLRQGVPQRHQPRRGAHGGRVGGDVLDDAHGARQGAATGELRVRPANRWARRAAGRGDGWNASAWVKGGGAGRGGAAVEAGSECPQHWPPSLGWAYLASLPRAEHSQCSAAGGLRVRRFRALEGPGTHRGAAGLWRPASRPASHARPRLYWAQYFGRCFAHARWNACMYRSPAFPLSRSPAHITRLCIPFRSPAHAHAHATHRPAAWASGS